MRTEYTGILLVSELPSNRLSQQSEKILFEQSKKFLLETGKMSG